MKERQSVMNCTWRRRLKAAVNPPPSTFRPDLQRVNETRVNHSHPAGWSECVRAAVQRLWPVRERAEALTATRKPPSKKKNKKNPPKNTKGESLNSDTSNSQPRLKKEGRLSGQHTIRR